MSLNNALTAYRHFGIEPYRHQIAIFETLLGNLEEPKPILFRAPTGTGKTEAAVIPFLYQAYRDEWPISARLIYVLPTRALCNQISERIKRYVEKTQKPIIVSVEHGAALTDPLFFSDICVTTFDQFLYGYARAKRQVGRHLDFPVGSIATSMVVFDEAHLYSPYTHALMRAMLEILHRARIPTLVMTATMPQSLETDLFRGCEAQKVGFSDNVSCGRNIAWSLENWPLLKDGKASPELKSLLDRSKDQKVLVVVNRVDVAQGLAKALADYKPALIHSRFTVADRKDKETQVERLLGKESPLKGALVISSQVCEVGLDISCDLLITECASSDALVQRIGRVARWGGQGKVVIVRPESPWPYYDKKLVVHSKSNDISKSKRRKVEKTDNLQKDYIEEADLTKIAWKYLENNAEMSFTDWNAVTRFCNEMKYATDDVAARGTLGQLFDATLYADEQPWNLSARGDLYCTVVIEPDAGMSAVEQQAKTEPPIPFGALKIQAMNVPYLWLKRKKLDGMGEYKDGAIDKKDVRLKPFGIFTLPRKGYYNVEIGLEVKDESPQDTEEAVICL